MDSETQGFAGGERVSITNHTMRKEFNYPDGHVELFIFWSLYNKEPIGYIHNVFTDPKQRRKGIGTRMVKEVLEYAKAKGCYKVVLVCKPELEPFYIHAGMTKSGSQMQVVFQ